MAVLGEAELPVVSNQPSSFRDAPSGADPESIPPNIKAARWIPGLVLRTIPE
jgi:hypothetical protein